MSTELKPYGNKSSLNEDPRVTKVTNETLNLNKNTENFKVESHQELVVTNQPIIDSEVRFNKEIENNTHKENRYIEECIDVTNVTNVTNKNLKVTKVTPLQAFSKHSFLGVLDKTLNLLYNSNEPLSYEEIAERTQLKEVSIKVNVLRNPELFQEIDRDGRIKKYGLTLAGRNRFEEILASHEKINQFETVSISKENERLRQRVQLRMEVSSFLAMYPQKIESKSIYINFKEVIQFSPALGDVLLERPDQIVDHVKDILDNPSLHVRFTGLPLSSHLSIENVRSEHIDTLIALEGRCVSISSVRPIIKKATFECPTCGAILTTYPEDVTKIREPSRCSCGRKGHFKIISTDLVNGSNVMLEDLQERTENPNVQRLRCRIEDELVSPKNINIFAPGNEIRAIGILRQQMTKKNGEINTNLGIYFEILHAELFEPEVGVDDFKEEDIKTIKELAEIIDQRGLVEVRESFAPEIFGNDEIKDAVILQLSCRRNVSKRVRNKPNILLIGDPGVSKSVLGTFVIDITPGARKAVGGGSSAVGITASVVKEEEDLGGYRVEPGALPLAKELLFLDELNNLSDDDKPKLQESMSEQTVTINKANLHVTLKVTAGILAAANPSAGYFIMTEDIIKQFNIPIPIMNRFDIIFIMKDDVNEMRDKHVAEKMLQREMDKISCKYSKDFLRKFFIYVRNQPDPIISHDIKEKLKDVYAQIRKGDTRKVMINPRFIEAITRLIKASAKLRLSHYVEEKDIQRCLEILAASHYNITYHNLFENLEAKR